MKLFLDTVELGEIKMFQQYGVVDGVTTNPTLMSKSDRTFSEIASDICDLVDGDVSLEVGAFDYENMINEGKKIADIAPNAVVKLPMTFDGIKACNYFSSIDIKVNMTLCFSPMQALIAGRAGAKYISPFIGRLNDIGENGIHLISSIRKIYDNYDIKTNILAASIRSVDHLNSAAIVGVEFATITAKVMSEIISHELTDKGLEQFTQDWLNSGQKI